MKNTATPIGLAIKPNPPMSGSNLTETLEALYHYSLKTPNWENEWHGWEEVDLAIENAKESLSNAPPRLSNNSLEFGQLLLTLIFLGRWYGFSIEDCLKEALGQWRKKSELL